MAKPIALSYSRLSTYIQCPLKFKAQYLDKDYPDEGDNYHFRKGKRKHGQLEMYTKSLLNPMLNVMQYDEDVESCLPMIDSIVASYNTVAAELQLAVDGAFVPTGWFGKKVMYRAIVDLEASNDDEALVIDWKTGKFRDYDDSATGQLHLTAAIEFARKPSIEKVTTAYVFIEHKQTIRRVFLRENFNALVEPFLEAWKQVNAEKDWKPKQNQYCKYCLLKADKCPLK